MKSETRVNEVWQGLLLEDSSDLHVIVESERRHAGRIRHTALNLEEGVVEVFAEWDARPWPIDGTWRIT